MTGAQGAGESQRYCTSCGAELRPGNVFCVSCGASLDMGNQDTGPMHQEAVPPERSGPDGAGRQTKLGGTHPEPGGASVYRTGTPGKLSRDAAAWFGGLSVLAKAVLVGSALLILVPWRPLATVVLLLFAGLIGRALISRMAPLADRGADAKLATGVVSSVGLVLIVGLLWLLGVVPVAWGWGVSRYEVVYEKEMSWMMGTMSGYDYTDNEGMIYIKVEVEDPESIDPAYEDLITHPKVTERDCVAVDFLVEGDRGGGIADERVIAGNQSCASDVEFFESRMGSLSEASRTNDVYGDELLKGERNPEGW